MCKHKNEGPCTRVRERSCLRLSRQAAAEELSKGAAIRCYLIGCQSASAVAARRAPPPSTMGLSPFYPPLCPQPFHSPQSDRRSPQPEVAPSLRVARWLTCPSNVFLLSPSPSRLSGQLITKESGHGPLFYVSRSVYLGASKEPLSDKIRRLDTLS
ncbi:hypothetical protein EYF80_059141 [Liparis tanakae]|uniref:Uncharacterized protein n=1 Tax=Liparis tanakae TaxID=230148 RepID=A0A4Z2EP35_9TELE|nr:hypothetical protein EYF80_059141 [Liparis tanakae]